MSDVDALKQQIASLEKALGAAELGRQVAVEQKNVAYSERNKLAAAFAKLCFAAGFNAGVGQHPEHDTRGRPAAPRRRTAKAHPTAREPQRLARRGARPSI